MLRFFPGLGQRGLGLDIQKHEIRLVQLRRKHHQVILEKAEIIALAANAIVDGKIQQVDEVQMALLTLIQKTKVGKCTTVIGLPANCMISKRVQLPANLTPIELETELTSHLSNYFPGIKELLFYDYMKLLSKDSRNDSIFVVAARGDQVMNYVNVVQSVGLKVAIVDIDLYALMRAVQFAIRKEVKQSSFILLDMSSSMAQMIVMHQEELIFYQSFMVDTPDQFYLQLKQAWHLYRGTQIELNLQPIFLLGGEPALARWIEQTFLMSTYFIDPLQNLLESSNVSCKLSAAFGLALRAIS